MKEGLYTIPSGVPFLKALAIGLLARHPPKDDPFALARVTVFLPTRRAVRALEEALLDSLPKAEATALLLPRLRPLGDVAEEAIALGSVESDSIGGGVHELTLLPAVPPLHRRVRLAQLLMRGSVRPQMRFSDALNWAESLESFLDEMLIEEADFSRIEKIVPEMLAGHFQKSLEFIRILKDFWPQILAEDGFQEAPERRRQLIDAQIAAWRAQTPGPVYVVGSTGSIPATARLMAAILNLPEGVLVLPGLDSDLPDDVWDEIEDGHPQAGLKYLLGRLECSRSDVAPWPYLSDLEEQTRARSRLLREALRPAPTTDSWARSLQDISLDDALAGLSLVIARDQAEEARIVALAMREVLETPKMTAAFVTPDRNLARSVAQDLKRWGVEVDDSAGGPLAQAPQLLLCRLILRVGGGQFAPVDLLSLLKHPLVQCGQTMEQHQTRVSQLEKFALRGPKPAPGLEGIKARIEQNHTAWLERSAHASAEVKARQQDKSTQLTAFTSELEIAFHPLTELLKIGEAWCQDWVVALESVIEQLAPTDIFWRGDAAEAAANVLRQICEATPGHFKLNIFDFLELLRVAIEGRAVRSQRVHPRLFIWGPLEARLQNADLMILGGLNEGVWPHRPDAGPWANRPMRAELGLQSPERRIGLAAHDFQELSSAPKVLLTASKKVAGAAALPSRWVMRLQNFLGAASTEIFESQNWKNLAHALNAPRDFLPVCRPVPKPIASVRPRAFSVTDIKTLRRDPYAIYARKILNLRVLDPVDVEAEPQERGIIFHRVFEEFALQWPDQLPQNAHEKLIALTEKELEALNLDAEARAFWLARMARAASVFLEWEVAERQVAYVESVEVKGEASIDAPLGPIVLTGRIDRIDKNRISGTLTILDYKTGLVPEKREVKSMLDPQLPLNALLVEAGAAAHSGPVVVDKLAYLRVGGAAGKTETGFEGGEATQLIQSTVEGAAALFSKYDDQSTPYISWAIPYSQDHVGDYDVLARVKEWRVESEGGEG